MRISGRLEEIRDTCIVLSVKEFGFALIHGKYDDCILEHHYYIPYPDINLISWVK